MFVFVKRTFDWQQKMDFVSKFLSGKVVRTQKKIKHDDKNDRLKFNVSVHPALLRLLLLLLDKAVDQDQLMI